ncbi:hypothetical protein [Rheinheimera mangrovi]|uniref:hypothetical protein n=1 Tax=Rheinheimera mangrovi TaxID=2498451 RepID=UPI000F8C7265|nr:hypothetical protein [Rheinheimera mangrovi]
MFERTADIGFVATDCQICSLLAEPCVEAVDAMQQPQQFSENSRYSDLQAQQKQSLIYARAVLSDQGIALGVLSLCFKLDD